MKERDESTDSAPPSDDPAQHTPVQSSKAATKNLPEEIKEPVMLEVTDVLDLHPFQPREIAEAVRTHLEEAHKKKFAVVRIIHGKGTGTQREIVRSVLGKTRFVTCFEDAPAQAGGWGATIAWLSD